MNSWLKAAICWAFRKSSVTRISEARDVSLTSEMNVLDSGGTETLAACGRMMRRRDWPRDMPMVCPASHCPFGTERMAARMISAA
ncbi:hypothetical protein D9M69_612650 [compost metagenome]|jgi:hypothetical protein